MKFQKLLVIHCYSQQKNNPFQLVIESLIGAISAGNCAVIKPSEISPNVSKVVTEMISKTFNKI